MHTALVALTRAADLRLGWLRDLEIAERLEDASPYSTGPADGVLAELWRTG